jgi:hypothetical protein
LSEISELMRGKSIHHQFIILGLALFGPALRADPSPISFNRDIQPILSKHCYECHGPDRKSRKGGFRLDNQESAKGNADSGKPPIVSGNPEESELLQRITTTETADLMPPKDSNKFLSTIEIQTLQRWIMDGAKWEEHWAYEPPHRPSLPTNRDKSWPRNAIDHFVLAKIEEQKSHPSIEVNLETLARRVKLDLTGLPPSPEEVLTFISDTREGAYERFVDRLMHTTAYAEKRAQDWLDLARYADTRGFADDKQRQVWPWRDWVIQAINRNIPFDQFTIEQLAGDMLPNARFEQCLATGFHRNAPQAKGQTYPVEEYRLKGVVDRVNTTSRVWLGLTMNCAECHDHKFDPITQSEYFSLFAIFNNIEHTGTGYSQGGPSMIYETTRFAEKQLKRLAEKEKLQTKLLALHKTFPTPQPPINHPALLGSWDNPRVIVDASKFNVTNDLTITATILTSQPIANIASKYDWRAKQRSYVFGIGGEGEKNGIPGHLFAWISSQNDPFKGAEIHGSFRINDGKEHIIGVEFNAGESLRLFVDGIEDKTAKLIGKIPESIAPSKRPLAIGSGFAGKPEASAYLFDGVLKDVQLYNAAIANQISIQGKDYLKFNQINKAIAKLDLKITEESNKRVRVPVMREQKQKRDTFIHIRGNFLNRGTKVSSGVPAMFGITQANQPMNRLEFARWLVDGKNPLVARVVVNQFWQSYFGQGIVSTPDDFGAQGALPTHPKLLDWLATEFVESGWDMKHIHRLIVTSATYRQSAKISPSMLQFDPNNFLLTRMPRLRLSAEQIRDQALAVSNLLVHKIGGLPVFPRQPQDYWQQRALPGTWTNGIGEDQFRRTIYTYWRRMALHPTLEILNAPSRSVCVPIRELSNVPTQALALLNDPAFHNASTSLARRIVHEINNNDEVRLDRAFLLVLSRLPQPEERKRFLFYLGQQREYLIKDPNAVMALSTTSHTQDKVDVAVWSLACSVLLNLDETITRP